jgi:hypothetical protein
MPGATNPPKVLARYTTSEGARVLQGQRILGVPRLLDVPADGGPGRRYVIEHGEMDSNAEVDAIVADYLQQARRWDAIPAEVCWLADTREEVAA